MGFLNWFRFAHAQAQPKGSKSESSEIFCTIYSPYVQYFHPIIDIKNLRPSKSFLRAVISANIWYFLWRKLCSFQTLITDSPGLPIGENVHGICGGHPLPLVVGHARGNASEPVFLGRRVVGVLFLMGYNHTCYTLLVVYIWVTHSTNEEETRQFGLASKPP